MGEEVPESCSAPEVLIPKVGQFERRLTSIPQPLPPPVGTSHPPARGRGSHFPVHSQPSNELNHQASARQETQWEKTRWKDRQSLLNGH